jgi:hypothetical protein
MSAAVSFDVPQAPVAMARSRAVTLAGLIAPGQRLVNWLSAARAALLALAVLVVERLGPPLELPERPRAHA